MNEELYNLLKKNVDQTGLPVMGSPLFLHTTEKYGKEEFRKTLAEFITKEKPPYPLKEFNMERVVDNFRKLQKVDFTKYLSQPETVKIVVFVVYPNWYLWKSFRKCNTTTTTT